MQTGTHAVTGRGSGGKKFLAFSFILQLQTAPRLEVLALLLLLFKVEFSNCVSQNSQRQGHCATKPAVPRCLNGQSRPVGTVMEQPGTLGQKGEVGFYFLVHEGKCYHFIYICLPLPPQSWKRCVPPPPGELSIYT